MSDNNNSGNGTKQWLQTFTTILGIIVVVITSVIYMENRFHRIDLALQQINNHVSDTWTTSAMDVYNYQLERLNDNLKVPDVRDIQERHIPK